MAERVAKEKAIVSQRERDERLSRDTQSIEDRESWRKRELEKER